MGNIKLKNGITLIEILVVTALVGLISIAFIAFSFSRKSEQSISSKNDDLFNLKKAMSILQSNLSTISNIIEIGEDYIIARKICGKRVSFYIDEKGNLIMATLKGIDEKKIVSGISKFNISIIKIKKSALLKYSLKIGKKGDFEATDSIFLRYLR